MMTYFKASSWDPLLQFITVGVTLFAVTFMYFNPQPVTIIAMGALILIPPFFMIKGYSIDDQKLIIHRLGWTKEFDIHNLVDAEFNAQAIRGSWRLMGNGGLFGWIGTFNNKELGTFRAYATNRHKCVVLTLKHKTLLVTPPFPR
ncbi:PH domain-containing protein [Fodinibius sediminis]|uniref:PH domain-containing protein n=1 Tax=Fodinibius sediminis TaxID=1214077 RepID=A0A521E5X7_9BACT|nr:PH domain-containing protein [Fodinibius sediminis]SMO79343.1 PH domain-containing protein [Fodinibius sediminis]